MSHLGQQLTLEGKRPATEAALLLVLKKGDLALAAPNFQIVPIEHLGGLLFGLFVVSAIQFVHGRDMPICVEHVSAVVHDRRPLNGTIIPSVTPLETNLGHVPRNLSWETWGQIRSVPGKAACSCLGSSFASASALN
jgi:hypothetical protein